MQGICKAFEAHGAFHAAHTNLTLSCALHKQGVGFIFGTQGILNPIVVINHVKLHPLHVVDFDLFLREYT